MRVTGVLATHYHPDHVGGSMMGHQIEGVAALLERCDCPIHVQRDEAPWVTRTTGVGDDAARRARCGRRRDGRRRRHHARPHARAHARQPVLPRRRSAGQRRHAVPRGVRAHRPAGQRPGGDVREPDDAREAPRRHDRLSRATATRVPSSGTMVGDPRDQLRVPAAAPPTCGCRCSAASSARTVTGRAGRTARRARPPTASASRSRSVHLLLDPGLADAVLALVGVDVDVVEVVLAERCRDRPRTAARRRLRTAGGSPGRSCRASGRARPARRAAAARRGPCTCVGIVLQRLLHMLSGRLSVAGARAYLRRPSVTCTQLP